MIILFLLEASLLGSFSLRTPNLQPNPMDWEIRIGAEKSENWIYKLEGIWERENGKQYKGLEALGYWYGIYGKEYYREAVGINSQELQIILPLTTKWWTRYILIGGGYTTCDWRNGKWVLSSGIGNNKFVSLLFTTNLKSRHLLDTQVQYKIAITHNFSIAPRIVYHFINTKEHLQAKIYLEYKLKEGV